MLKGLNLALERRMGDGIRYIPSMVKLLHLWRDKAVLVYKELASISETSAMRARYVPPQCVSTRWGSISRCERYVQAVPRDHLKAAMQRLCIATQKTRSRSTGPDGMRE
eukprot:9034296-Pyramimonas_sp.AAC.1